MNKRQKKKLYKKLHGHNPPKEPKRQLPEPQPKQTKDTVKTITELCSSITEKMSKAAEELKEMGRLVGKLFTECLTFPWLQSIIKAAEEHERQQALQQKYFKLEAKEPPCIVVAEALTRQRAAGKRKKYHTRNRRKRKWH